MAFSKLKCHLIRMSNISTTNFVKSSLSFVELQAEYFQDMMVYIQVNAASEL